MRAIKLAVILLFALPLLTLGYKSFPTFFALAQAGALSAPAGVIASDNAYANKVGINWTTVQGATLYRIFRNTSNDTASAISVGTTAANTFFDTTAVVGQTSFYWVRAENSSIVSGLSAPDQGTRAVGVNGGLPPPPEPPGNPVTATKAYLGKTLFWDEQLSSTRTVACGTCHFATNGGSDSRTLINSLGARNPGADQTFNTDDDVFGSAGVPNNNADATYNWDATYGFREQVTGRKSRSYIDAAFSNLLFWDGRATGTFRDPITGAVVIQNGAALESQVLGPPVSSAEMGHNFRNWNDVAARVAVSKPLALSLSIPAGLKNWIGGRSYPELFQEAFGTPDVTPVRIAMAIATFERTVYSDRTPVDQSLSQIAPLTGPEARGQAIFNGQGRCNTCHAGILFSDNQFHNIGLRPQTEDAGRGAITGNPNDVGAFRTPSLRNVGLRAPYMHNGRLATLEDVVDFYNRGGDFNAPNIDRNRIRQLNLSPQQRADLVAFLRNALTDPRVANGTSPFDRPTLYSESNRVPQIVGSGTAGSGGLVPQVTAIEPPFVGNPNFTVGVSDALGGAQAVLVINSSDPGTGPAIPTTGALALASVTLARSGAGQGFGSVSISIPPSFALAGTTFFGRWFVTDPRAPGGVAVTPAFRITIFSDTTTSNANPIDDQAFFIHQQYIDFLGREPEATGFQFWMDRMNNCPAGQICDRIDTSQRFFQSDEFQERGFYVYRLYKALLGRLPRYAEFVPDVARLNGSQTVTEQRLVKDAYLLDFMTKQEFRNLYGAYISADGLTAVDAAGFVNALCAKAGITPLSKQTLIDNLQNKVKDPAHTLEDFILTPEMSNVGTLYYDQGFITMQYFGYLRRDPEQAGFDFWVGQLIGEKAPHKQDYRFMVGGFLQSDEYRFRFALNPAAP
jgi:cytochrome c peroxidase